MSPREKKIEKIKEKRYSTKTKRTKRKEDIKDLETSIKDKHKSNTKLALKRVKSGIEKCDFK